MLKIPKGTSTAVLHEVKNIIDDTLIGMLTPKPKDPVTVAKIEANRRNALHSTGPRTEAGKQASSANAIKHGLYSTTLLLKEEDPEQYAVFCDRYLDELQPEGIVEENLVRQMIAAQWKLARLNVVEQGVYDKSRQWLTKPNKPIPTLTEVQMEVGRDPNYLQALSRVSQLSARLERDYSRASRELRQLQKERQAAQPKDSANSETPESSVNSKIDKTNPPIPSNAGIAPPPTPQDSATSATPESSSNSEFSKTNPPIPPNAGIAPPTMPPDSGTSVTPESSVNSESPDR